MAFRWNDENRTLTLAPRDLLDLGRIDLARGPGVGRRLAMSSASRLARGRAVHQAIQAEWEEPEVALRWTTVVRAWTVTVNARADGLWREPDGTLVEEIKSTALDAAALDAAVVGDFAAWIDQLALYVTFAAESRLPSPSGVLRVVSLVDGASRQFVVPHDPLLVESLRERLDREVWRREDHLHWQGVRRAGTVHFPHATLRPGQEEIVATVKRSLAEGRHLLLTAPTGLGKTAAVLHGALEIAASRGIGVYWATARTTQQEPVARVFGAVAALGTPLRTVVLRAREKVCLRIEDGEELDCGTCRFATGYRERLPAALDALPPIAPPQTVVAVARAAEVCPYELAVDRGKYADVVVGDYNLAFDPEMAIGRLFGEREWIYVVDEAHQLPERIAQAASPALRLPVVEAAITQARGPGWAALLDLALEIRDEILDAGLRVAEGMLLERPGEGRFVPDEILVEPRSARWSDLAERLDELALDHARLRASEEDAWLELARALHRFAAALERAGEETVAVWGAAGIRLVCRDPGRVLREPFASARGSVLMSATLAPDWFYRERCGLEAERTDTLSIPSPFPPENRAVVVVPGVSTAWRDRDEHRPKIASLVDDVITAVPGNVAVYVSSYEMARDLVARCTFGGRELLLQSQEADDAGREGVLAALRAAGPPRVLLAVLGGSFAEGIDLPEGALSAVLVVGPGIPPPSLDRLLLQAWLETRYDAGFDLAWIQPGMIRVVQAAGRLVRGPEDRGLVVLLCRRFLRTEHARYLPGEWVVEKSSRPGEVARRFWRG